MFGFAPRQSWEWEELLHNRGKEGNLSTECEVLKKPSAESTHPALYKVGRCRIQSP